MKAALLRHPQAVLAALIILASLAVAPARLPRVSVCPFRSTTGLPCPGCGLTRAFCAIGHGELSAAWAFNPFSFVLFALAVFLVFQPLLRRRAPALFEKVLTPPRVAGFTLGLVAAMFVFGVWRIVTYQE